MAVTKAVADLLMPFLEPFTSRANLLLNLKKEKVGAPVWRDAPGLASATFGKRGLFYREQRRSGSGGCGKLSVEGELGGVLMSCDVQLEQPCAGAKGRHLLPCARLAAARSPTALLHGRPRPLRRRRRLASPPPTTVMPLPRPSRQTTSLQRRQRQVGHAC